MTITSWSASSRMMETSGMCFGSGEATTLRYFSPSGAIAQPRASAKCSASCLSKIGPIGLVDFHAA
jgi:hypothetical protein